MRIVTMIILMLGIATAVQAQNRPVVVELFTSQGCSSCPPADAFLHDLSKDQDVIALAYHVDYWDYIGWKDIFADPSNTTRQRAYAAAAGERMIYTPQMVVQGRDHAVGNRRGEVAGLVRKYRNTSQAFAISLTRQNGQAVLDLARAPVPGSYSVVLIEILPSKTVQIERGENAGRQITYSNIVRQMFTLGNWSGEQTTRYKHPATQGLRLVALVQDSKTMEIIAAAQVN